MKKTILILIACLLIPLNAYALSPAIQAVLCAGGVAACSQSTIYEQTTASANAGIARTGRNYAFTTFTIPGEGTATVKRVEIYWKKNGTPTSCSAGVVSINPIVSTNCDEANPIATADSTFNIANLSTDLRWDGFNFTAGVSLTKGTQYCVLVYCAAVEASGTDASIAYNAEVAGDKITYSADGSSWTSTDSSAQWNFRLETCTE